VLVGLALVTAPEAGLLLVLGGAVVAAEDVAAGGDEGVELRVAVRLEATLLTADDTTLPLEPHAATSQAITTIRLAKTAHFFLTLAPSRTDGLTSARSVRGQSQAERHPSWVTRRPAKRMSSLCQGNPQAAFRLTASRLVRIPAG